jgi:hypothetical protein
MKHAYTLLIVRNRRQNAPVVQREALSGEMLFYFLAQGGPFVCEDI